MTDSALNIKFIHAKPADASAVAQLVEDLTREICTRTETQHFNIDLETTTRRCQEFLEKGYYAAITGYHNNKPVAVATIAETYALYAGGKIGIIQEFYVAPDFRSAGIGERLLAEVRAYGKSRDWACIELCTPPLPEFARTLDFYQNNGLIAVGGRKMRQRLND